MPCTPDISSIGLQFLLAFITKHAKISGVVFTFFPDWRIIDSHRRILPFEQFEALADPASHGFQSFLLSLVLCLSCKQRHPNAIISFPIIYNILTFTASCTLCSTNSKSVFASNTIFFENKCNIINSKKMSMLLTFSLRAVLILLIIFLFSLS